jgi:hypothetical protein
MHVPALPLAAMPEPLKIFVDFDAETVDEIIEQLSVLRCRCCRRIRSARPNVVIVVRGYQRIA